jgi:transglutaminase-like putative cysteine protease
MILKLKITRITLALVAINCFIFIGFIKNARPDQSYPIPLHIEYSFTLKNTTPHLSKNILFWAYAPVKQTATQKSMTIKASHPYQLILDDQGNQILCFTIDYLSPFATKIIRVESNLLLSTEPNPIILKNKNAYLQAEKNCESDDQQIIHFAQKLKARDTVQTAMNVFRWILDNLRYSGYIRNVRGALYALKNKMGDCTEYMYLFAALCRANQIPTRCIGGYVYAENAILKADAYHNWVEFYNNGTWQIVDPQKGVFLPDTSHYFLGRG